MKRSLPQNAFSAGVIVTLLVGAASSLLIRAGITHDLSLVLTVGAGDALLLFLLSESMCIGRRTAGMAIAGTVMGSLYFLIVFGTESIYLSASDRRDYFYYFVYGCLLAPLFEEIVLRRILFFWVSQWIGFLASAILVSLLFAFAHRSMLVYAFVFSMLTCFLAYRGVTTVDRVAFHGSHNLVLQLMFVAGGW